MADSVLDGIRDSRSHQRAGHPAKFATRRTPRYAATSGNRARLAARKRPNSRPFLNREPADAHREDLCKLLGPVLNPRASVKRPVTEQEHAHGRSASRSGKSGPRTHQSVGCERWPLVDLH